MGSRHDGRRTFQEVAEWLGRARPDTQARVAVSRGISAGTCDTWRVPSRSTPGLAMRFETPAAAVAGAGWAAGRGMENGLQRSAPCIRGVPRCNCV